MPMKVKKRSGKIEKFSYKKLYDSIHKSIQYSHTTGDSELAKKLAAEVVKTLNSKFKKKIPTVEEIKKITSHTLSKRKLNRIMKSYLLFRYH